ncbi:hypothetical protein VTN96DRAFT_5757 [Rasamsonia emersonii]|uniref:Uncharacterized protein n=1 Tax=Rasamsonia emersonii (strain ATCC 16479 / CBS 393.64 / IMI 116815) TaxID=1408163 RepID=A0A0F4Z0F8_RASE3|nr:hypothetical protein T310_2125 [Rasamsonia emersonii CBS 393.64]KKA23835.1 hypothetical protein T310_2125 [Rasamsonia emersonii CBS 393.64]
MSEKQNDGQPEPLSPGSKGQSASKDGSNNKSSSLASRIQNSASTLVRDAVTRPSGQAVGADLSQTLGNSSKAGSSRQQLSGSSAASAAMESFSRSSHTAAGFASGAEAGGVGGSAPESFRSPMPVHGGVALDAMGQDQFQNEYGDELLFGNSVLSQPQGKGKGKGREIEESPDVPRSEFHDAWEAAFNQTTVAGQSTTSYTAPPHTSLQNSEDGAAVVSLLSDPAFQPEFLPTEDDPTDYSVIDTVPPLTAEEIQIIDSFRRHPSSSQGTEEPHHHRPITSRSLIPDIDSFLAQQDANNNSHAAVDTATLRDTVLSNLPGAEDWIGVEDRYHEEVWGYLRPTLEAASKELEEKKKSPGKEEKDGPAVRRLKMILRHMQR